MSAGCMSSVRKGLWFGAGLAAMCTLVGAGLLFRHQSGLARQQMEKQRAVAMAETYAAQVAPLIRPGRERDVESFIERLPLHPDARLLAVLDRGDHTLAVRGNTALLEDLVAAGPERIMRSSPAAWIIAGNPARRMPSLTLVSVPIASPDIPEVGFLVYAARLTREDRFAWREMGFFSAVLAGVSLVGTAIGFLWMRGRVLTPLTELAGQVRQASLIADPGIPDVLAGREDEIGATARAIAEMRQELNEWRGKASQLERSVDHRVAAETQKITRELRQVERKAFVDPLTRLGNRRLLLDKFSEIFAAQKKAGRDLSVILIDVDHFKEVNDTLGHKAGDELLVFVGELLEQCLREQDLAIRYGGDEFLLILPSVNVSNAASVAERTMRLFAQQARVLAVQPKPSMSAGVASLLAHHPDSSEQLLEMADQALYEAKRTGKSQVRVASGLTVTVGGS